MAQDDVVGTLPHDSVPAWGASLRAALDDPRWAVAFPRDQAVMSRGSRQCFAAPAAAATQMHEAWALLAVMADGRDPR